MLEHVSRGRERFLEAVLGSAIDYAILATDLDGAVTVWSAGATRMLGWPAPDMIGKSADIFFTPEDQAASEPAAERETARQHGRCSVERWHISRDGTRLWARTETTPLTDEAGTPYGYLKIMRDRTPQRNLLEKQRADAEFLRRLLASSADCIMVLDLQAQLQSMTETGQRLMDVDDFASIEGCFWPDFWTAPARALARAAIDTAKSGSTGRFQGEAATLKGTLKYWDVQVTAVPGPDGRPERLLAVARDLTAIRAAEAALREAQGLNSLILDSSSDCIVVLDLEGHTQYVSPGGLRSMDIADPAPIIGLSWLRVWTGRDNDNARAAVAQAREGHTGRFQGFCATHRGTPKWWDVVVSPLPGADGRPARLVSIGRDITDLRAAEDEARQMAGLVHGSTEFIATFDPALNVRSLNPAAQYLLGIANAAPNLALQSFAAPEDQPLIDEAIRPALRNTGHWRGELRFRHTTTGATIPVLANLFPLRDAHRTLTGYGSVIRDLTDLRRATARRVALAELGDRLRELTDPAEIAQVAAALAGRTLGANRTAYCACDPVAESVDIEQDWTTTGYQPLSGTYAFRDFGSYFDSLRQGKTVQIHNVAQDPRTAPEAANWHAISVQALINVPIFEQDELKGVFLAHSPTPRVWTAEEVEFLRNVADRTRAAIARLRAEQSLRDLAASLERQVEERTADRNRMWQLSADIMLVARKDGTILATNPAWQTVLGWTEAELHGLSVFELVHPDSLAGSRRAGAEAAAGAAVTLSTSQYRHRDGSYRWISWRAVPGGGLINAVGRDVTAERAQAETLHQTEEALRQSQKMEAVGQLTGGIAHDFNNLLAGITGSLELMQARIAQGRTADLARYANAAHGAAQRAAALTHRLLAFSRQQTLDPKPTDVNRLIADMEELVRRTVGPAITLEVVGSAGLWTTLCDPNQLENALLNLCINARDAMPAGGRLTIETANASLDDYAARLRGTPAGQYIALSVTDTGTGMPPEIAARVFDPFFTTKPLGQGTGLGLSMVYGFAKQSGGEAKIYSEPGQGTTVKIYLPRHYGDADEATQGPPELAAAPRAEAHETVLVVDDEPTLRMLVAEILHDLGYAAVEAADGPAALQILQSDRKIDLLVTDVGLPGGMNGRQLADAARALRPGLHILFVTGYAENAALGHGQIDPGMHIMTKPFSMEALATKIRAMLTKATGTFQTDQG